MTTKTLKSRQVAEHFRVFAITNNEQRFADMVTAALAGEKWAIGRLLQANDGIARCLETSCRVWSEAALLVIRNTNTARPEVA